MTVKELRNALEGADDNLIVVMSKDGEGNSFSPLADADTESNVYVPDSTWSGEIHIKELTPELKKQGFTDEDVYDGDDGQVAVVLWPTN